MQRAMSSSEARPLGELPSRPKENTHARSFIYLRQCIFNVAIETVHLRGAGTMCLI